MRQTACFLTVALSVSLVGVGGVGGVGGMLSFVGTASTFAVSFGSDILVSSGFGSDLGSSLRWLFALAAWSLKPWSVL